MQNRLLSLTRSCIPYVKELRPVCGSVLGCLVMQQAEYWFEKQPEGFFKFKEPSMNPAYRVGDSWTEELGISAEEFTTSFAKIGQVYISKRNYQQAEDKFQNKFYCSYFDRSEGLTFYFRNHEVVDNFLDCFIQSKQSKKQPKKTKTEPSETDNHGLQKPTITVYDKPTITVYRNRQSRFTETDNHGLHTYSTENTSEITSEERENALTPETQNRVEEILQKNVVEPAPPPNCYQETPSVTFKKFATIEELRNGLVEALQDESYRNGLKQDCEFAKLHWIDDNASMYIQLFAVQYFSNSQTPLSTKQAKDSFRKAVTSYIVVKGNENINKNSVNQNIQKNERNGHSTTKTDKWHRTTERLDELIEVASGKAAQRDRTAEPHRNPLDQLDIIFQNLEQSNQLAPGY